MSLQRKRFKVWSGRWESNEYNRPKQGVTARFFSSIGVKWSQMDKLGNLRKHFENASSAIRAIHAG